jgi:prolyl oligopeptidase
MTQSLPPQQQPQAPQQDDANLWLEDIDGDAPLAWARQENAKTVQAYAQSPAFKALEQGILEVLDSDERIPMVRKIGLGYYNFWRDKAHPKGLWRRTTLAEYRKPQPVWETVLDLDALAAADGENWVWHGADCLDPDYKRCLISLSRGGADADVVREFDLEAKQFVEGGFTLPEAKNHVGWKDIDHLYVATDFGPGSMTSSSYPRIVKEWQRGTPLASAVTVYEGAHEDMSVSAYRDNTPGFERDFVSRQIDFYESETWLRGSDGKLTKIDVPDDSNMEITREWMLIEPREDWAVGNTTYTSGSLLATRFDDFMAGKREITVLFEPDDTTALDSHSWTRHHLIVNVMHDVVNRLEVLTPPADGIGPWARKGLGGAPALSTIDAGGIDEDENDDYFLTVSGFLQPTTLYIGTIGQGEPEVLKDSPGFFDASRYQVSQHFTTSKDGTRVPYFEIAASNLVANGKNPTLQYAYGGFEISLQPSYSGSIGRAWLDQGGVYVIANIRGGGEYGPRWHQAALQENRLRTCEDFAAVSEDLVRAQHHLARAPGRDGRQQRRPADGQHAHAVPAALRRHRERSGTARHEALHAPVGRRLVDRRVRRPGPARGMGLAADLLALREREAGAGVSAGAVHHLDPRRPRRPGACAQDAREDGRAGPRQQLLREHGRRPQRGDGQQGIGLHGCAGLCVPVASHPIERPRPTS